MKRLVPLKVVLFRDDLVVIFVGDAQFVRRSFVGDVGSDYKSLSHDVQLFGIFCHAEMLCSEGMFTGPKACDICEGRKKCF
jgi:hypothetical protein